MANSPPKHPYEIHLRMVEMLKAHPEGLSEAELRMSLNVPTHEQGQFGRRRRELKIWFNIKRIQAGRKSTYVFVSDKDTPMPNADFNAKTRAEVLHLAHGRCGMCGKTIEKHGITLVIDHKIPRDWGGTGDIENLWAICEECNAGKKAHFATMDQSVMKQVMAHESVHVRLGELLKLNVGKPVASRMLEFVADVGADDWEKRLRELRYLKWDIRASRKKENGIWRAYYTLHSFTPWPERPSQWIQEYERQRAKTNREKKAAQDAPHDSLL